MLWTQQAQCELPLPKRQKIAPEVVGRKPKATTRQGRIGNGTNKCGACFNLQHITTPSTAAHKKECANMAAWTNMKIDKSTAKKRYATTPLDAGQSRLEDYPNLQPKVSNVKRRFG